jgi:hypothetical protein
MISAELATSFCNINPVLQNELLYIYSEVARLYIFLAMKIHVVVFWVFTLP